MTEFNQREYQAVLLGALLHDVGKFYQRGLDKGRGDHQQLGDECFERYFAEGLSNLLSIDEIGIVRSAINNHHGHSEFITLADGLSAGMERIELENEEHGDPTRERLQSVFEKVSLGNNDKKVNEYTYRLKSLSLKNDELFPDRIPEQSLKEEYKGLWKGFAAEIKNIPTLNLRSYLNTLYAILQKYTWCIPSAAYKHEPDISLFDHLKTTAAIAGCLYHNKRSDNTAEKEFLLVAGDISGIQNFIYRIAKSQRMGGISKRLRGRSFYLLLLQEVIARYIIEKVGLFSTNILFCGGGRFELILPNTETTQSILTNAIHDINRWLFDEYSGELGIVIEWVETDRNGLGDYSSLLEQLDEKLSTAKKRKFNALFEDTSFWCEKGETNIRICKVCGIGKVEDDKKPCKLCDQHKDIGERLPKNKMDYLIFASSGEKLGNNLFEISFDKFGTVYMIPKGASIKDNWLKSGKILDIQKINDLDDLETGFRFIGNTAPVAIDKIEIGNEKADDEDKVIHKDGVLSFEAMAEASIGDKRIGILKMDVDCLGLIFAIGLEPKQKSISRITSLSRSIDMFFSGYLNKICDDVFDEWKNDKNNKWEHKDKVNQIFYIVYSGGDDLLIVGPWSEMPKLAKKINDEFKDYTCKNPDINISAGIFLCKPKYPISLAAKGAGEALEASKDKGRKRITLFDDTVEWISGNNNLGMKELLIFGEQLYSYISNKDLPRGFVHGLLRKHKQYRGGDDHNFIPAIIYQLVRNIKDDDLRMKLKAKLIADKNGYFKKIKIPASYTLLKSRKEG